METWNKLKVTRRKGDNSERGGEAKQKTYVNDPWTKTITLALTVCVGGSALGRGGQWGKNWGNSNRITIKSDKTPKSSC